MYRGRLLRSGASIEVLLGWDPDNFKKSEDKFAGELKKMFSKTAEQLFSLMSFEGSGERTVNKMIEFYGFDTINDIMLNDQLPTTYPEGIGQKTVEKLWYTWQQNYADMCLITKDRRWKPASPSVKVATGQSKIADKTFLITGTLSKPRKQIEKNITDMGGKLSSSVSKTLDYLVVGQDAGSKLDKAEKLGVKCITEDELNKLLI
jgi:DNA ligase (NAD+)